MPKGVLGDHDSIRMVPDLEAMGIRLLLNEFNSITRAGASIYVAGIDDAHYFPESITSKRLLPAFRIKHFRSYYRTRLKFIGRRRMLASTCC